MKRLLFIAVIALLMSACNKPQEIYFSVLGDSFTSCEGTVDPDTNYIWPSYVNIGVTPDLMWFNKVAERTGWHLEKNNSFSGSHITNIYDYAPDGVIYSKASYLNRMDNLGTPNVIFIFGGTNDIYNRVPVGEYVYKNWTDEQLCTLRPALAYMFHSMKKLYPRTKIYFMLDMGLCIDDTSISDTLRQNYIESMHTICGHYGIESIDIYGIQKSKWHPNAQGQATIAQKVIEAVREDFDI